MLPRFAEVIAFKKWVIHGPRLMNPFEPLHALLNEPVMTGNTICRYVALAKAQCVSFSGQWIPLNPAPERFLKMILVKHNLSLPST
jgi:hypothetical protein